jgi:hypothetical protein
VLASCNENVGMAKVKLAEMGFKAGGKTTVRIMLVFLSYLLAADVENYVVLPAAAQQT